MNKLIKLLIPLYFVSCSWLSYSLMSADGRKNELRAISAKVVKAVSWEEFDEVVKFMDEESVDKGFRQLKDQFKNVKIKEVKEANLDFDEDMYTAYQVLEIDGFSPPSFTVRNEFTQFEWKFVARENGWKIVKISFGVSPVKEGS